ncbi:hypothetical protein GQ42DRAFT_171322 [Ramicandelaber brevisporus]|nr:hypothetical protein GQ42DRAFT_171322 [Ramicandelaber brevisporus]
METNVSEETDLALLRGVVNQLVTIITRYSDILDYFPVQRASCQLYPVTSLADQKKAFELDQIEDSNAHKHFNAAWKQRKVTAREFGPVVVAGDRYRGFKQSLGHQIVKNIMSHHAPNTKLMLIVGAWKSDNSHRFKDLVSPFAPVTTVSEFRTSITSAVSGKITSASCEIPKKTYKYNGREWTGRISELYGYSNQAAMRARVRYIPGGGSINRDINGAAGIVIQSLHVSAMTAVSWQQNLDTPVGNEKNKAHGSLAIGSGTVRNAMMYLGKLASICTTASITVDYLDLYNIWPQIYPFSTIMFTDDKTYNNAAGYYKTLSYTNVKNELIFKKLLPKLSKQLRGLVFAVIAINSNDKVKLNELWNIVCKQPGIEQLTAQQEAGVIKKAGIPDVEVDDIQDEDDDEEEVEDDDGKKVFVDNNNIPLRELLKTNPQFTVGVNSKLKDVVEGVVSVFVDQFGKDVVNFARRKRCHKQIGNAVDCSKVLVALYAISFFQASFFLGLDKTGRFIPDADRSHYAQMLAIDNYNNVPTVTSAREVTADFMQLLRKRFPVLRVLPAVPGDHKTTNIKVDHYLSLGKVSDNAPKKIKKRKTK